MTILQIPVERWQLVLVVGVILVVLCGLSAVGAACLLSHYRSTFWEQRARAVLSSPRDGTFNAPRESRVRGAAHARGRRRRHPRR